MNDPLLTRLRANDPAAATDPEDAGRDALILARVLADPIRSRRRSRTRLALVAAGCGLAALALALGVGRERSGSGDFDAAAATYRALTRTAGIYHFVSVSRMTSTPPGVAQSYVTPASLPPVRFSRTGAPQYHEVWLTPGGGEVRWLAYRRPGGGLLHAFAFRRDRKKPLIGPPCPMPCSGPPSDPATALSQAYKGGRLRRRGSATLDNRALWRFVSRKTGTGSYQEWLVDPKTRLPVRYRHADHNQQGGVAFTTRLTIELTKFEVLPLNGGTRTLLHLTPSQRRLCLAARRAEHARAQAYFRARGRRVPPSIGRPLRNCR